MTDLISILPPESFSTSSRLSDSGLCRMCEIACGLSDIHCWDVLARNQFTQLTSLGLTDITGMSSEDWSQILLMQQQNEILEVGNRAGITQYLNSIIATIEAGWIVWAQRLEETKILNLELTAVKGVTGAVLEHFEQVESLVLLRVSRIYSLTNAGINAFRIIEGSNPGLMERQHDMDLVGSESGALSNLSESTD
ncbi:hypothetical protein BDB00DRAFT_783561 [Zychaea mexicana]|uniref:uncharacterized protein n=1 Tax=Zychaea mexicana TaxID=64656 RepID=UPI0022FDC91C|nr:uncharacterized protein BDB00DRAFT_783561 [Zychaea mexicana]KAI9498952.1 hypothetical protein BDB00DRAFT_783561 [Zychaea mexicana]